MREDNLDVLRCLLEGGANPDTPAMYGITPLALAAREGYPRILELLIDAGASLDSMSTRNGVQYSPLSYAAFKGNIECIQLLLSADADKNKAADAKTFPLFLAALFGHVGVVRVLLEAGVAANGATVSGEGAVPLCAAAHKGYVSIVRLLVEADADVNLVNEMGNTPLLLAACNGHVEIVNCLLSAGAVDFCEQVCFKCLPELEVCLMWGSTLRRSLAV